MATDLNCVAVTGRLVRDPELRTVGDTSVCELRIAVNDRRKVGGEWDDVAGFYDVSIWSGQGETAARFLTKGRQVAVSGRLQFREWTTDDGQKRSAVSIVADRVTFIGPREDSGSDDHRASATPASAPAPSASDTDSIPF
jgi:single-strand DNA-binding protein